MPLGTTSRLRLASVHPKLRRVIEETMARLDRHPGGLDFTVTCGHRGEASQEQAFSEGKSTKHWPDSLHNRLPSLAVDLAPYPTDWADTAAFARLAGYVQAVADDLDVEIRWGGDWNGNGRTTDERLKDAPHFELTERELNRP
jgi:peptidoglycan LD-endopeptidase CwlK